MNKKDADQPVHQNSLVDTSVVHCLNSAVITDVFAASKCSKVSNVSVAELLTNPKIGFLAHWLKLIRPYFSYQTIIAYLK